MKSPSPTNQNGAPLLRRASAAVVAVVYGFLTFAHSLSSHILRSSTYGPSGYRSGKTNAKISESTEGGGRAGRGCV